jgi:hypothetical protein
MMNRPTRWIALLAVFVVLTVIVTISLSYIGMEEQPPCHACTQTATEVPQVTVCELTNNLQKFAGKFVLVAAQFRHDSGQVFLIEDGCTMSTGFAKERLACIGAWRKLQMTSGVETDYDSIASVEVIGTVSMIPPGNFYAGREGFTISCLQRVRTEPLLSQRIRFAIWRLFWSSSSKLS